MRSKNKMTTQRSRKLSVKQSLTSVRSGNVTFHKDNEVSSRILAVLSTARSKQAISIVEKVLTPKVDKDGKPAISKKTGKPVNIGSHKKTGETFREIERHIVCCGSNNKIGVWYNRVFTPADKISGVLEKDVRRQQKVGRELTKQEFISMFPSQCEAFKKNFQAKYDSYTVK